MAPANITFSKNGVTVTVHTQQVVDNYDNKFFIITPPTAPANQSGGNQTNQIVNLLRITHQIVVTGEITGDSSLGKSAVDVKNDLLRIYKGAGANGGAVTMTYEGYTGGILGQIEKLMFIEKSQDEPSSVPDDLGKYTVQITFDEGKEAGT